MSQQIRLDGSDIRVDTPLGRIVGRWSGGVARFLGIPYAQAPVGDRRFRPPVLAERWSDELVAQTPGPIAPQYPSVVEKAAMASAQLISDEDCLNLNIFTPDFGQSLPVMLFIHGGSFVSGSGALPFYDGTALAAAGQVVVVTINYRLGALGFAYLAHVRPDLAETGSLGLLDQLAAVSFTKRLITSFGGDPNNVTVFGESSGAMSIASWPALELPTGTFSRAILQSGGADNLFDPDQAAEVTELLARSCGIEPGRTADLVEVDTDTLLAAQAGLTSRFDPLVVFRPVVGSGRHPLAALGQGSLSDVDLLIGTNRHEAQTFALADPAMATLTREELPAYLRTRCSGPLDLADAVALLDAYEGQADNASPMDLAVAAATDLAFALPALDVADAHLAGGGRCLRYLFGFESPALGGILRSCHTLELPFVFGNIHLPETEMLVGTGEVQTGLAASMMAAWSEFARSGRPTLPDGGLWPEYLPASPLLAQIGGPASSDWHVASGELTRAQVIWQRVRRRWPSPVGLPL
jgi:para-nitrobenzyl esterase